jgi:hypothetical protein
MADDLIPNNLIQIATLISNISIVAVGVKLTRHLSRMEFKVELMWEEFNKRILANRNR